MDSSGLDKSGWVNKKANVMPSWNPRYMIADPRNLRLKYFKDRPTQMNTKERGELLLTNCTVSVDQTNNSNNGDHRFLITTADSRRTFHLEVGEQYEMSEWMRVVRLISDLGVTKQRIIEEHKCADNFETFKSATERLLKSLDNQATESRLSLDRIAKQKWKSKCRLVELRDEMEEKHRKLRIKQQEMKAQEKNYREELSHLNQTLYVLQQQVRRSNEIQQQVVEIFGSNNTQQSPAAQSQSQPQSIEMKARQAVQLCRNLLAKRHPKQQKKLQYISGSHTPKMSLHENDAAAGSRGGKGRARSYSDLTVSKSDVFEEEMSKIILEAFPNLLTNAPQSSTTSNAMSSEFTSQNPYELQNNDVIKIFELYHRYYVEVHLPREMELRKVRTKCEQKYNSLRYVSNKKELARREEDEIDWVMMEMKRAIDRLNREGVRAPNEPYSKNKNSKNNSKNNKNKNHNHNSNNAESKEPDHYQPPQNTKRDSSAMIPVLAHRSTWSEASEDIFQLNVARQQQYQATKDLEESLTSREVVKSWYEEKIANQ